MLEAFQLEKVPRVIVIGSATLYQDCDGRMSETDLDLNQDPPAAYMGYGSAARFMEKMCRFVHERFGTNIVIVRAANIFGAYARFDPATSNVIPALIRKAVDRMDPFEVWGNPEVTRDVIYSEDFAEAVVKLLDHYDGGFDIFNIGSGERTTIDQIVKWVLASAGHEPQSVTYVQDRPTTMKSRVLDCSKIRSMIDWTPRHEIQQGIAKTTQWWIENRASWTR
jgi:GDP-L-fucose synthase